MPENHDINHFHLPLLNINRELRQLYASLALRGFAVGLIIIFEPIYIYLFFDRSVSSTLIYFAVVSLLFGLLSPYGAHIVQKIGVKHAMLFGMAPFLFLYYLGLWNIEALGIFFPLLILLKVAHNIFYWPAFHMDFSRFSDHAMRGRQLSYRRVATSLFAAAAPFVGGFIIAVQGFPLLFAVVLALLFASGFFLFLSPDIHETYQDSYQKAFREIFRRENWRKVVAFAANGGESAVNIFIWPLFLFLLSISFTKLGGITSAALLAGIFLTLYLGRLTDRIGHSRALILGAWFNALLWPLKMFVRTPFDAFLIHVLHGFGRTAAYIPFASLFYDWTAQEGVNRARTVVFREIIINGTRALLLSAFAFIFLFTDNLALAFPLAGAFSLFLTFLARREGS